MTTCPISVTPGQILGYVNGRPVRAIAGGSEPVATPTPAAPVAAPPAPAAPPVATPPAPAPSQKVEDLPDWAQTIIADVRKEAGDARVAGKTAADAAKQELAQTIGKALGLVKDDEPVDPAELHQQITAKDTTIRDLTIRTALSDALHTVGAKPIARAAILGDRILADLDHTAADFEAKVQAKVSEYITKNPELKAGQAPAASGISTPGGPGPSADIDAQIAAATKDGNHQLAISLKRHKAYAPKG